MKEIAKLYDVNVNAIKKYDFNNPIDVIYFHIWLEEEFPYYEINFDCDSYEKTDYNDIVQNAIREWKQMKEKRENLEISDDEYIEWKLKIFSANLCYTFISRELNSYIMTKNILEQKAINDNYEFITMKIKSE